MKRRLVLWVAIGLFALPANVFAVSGSVDIAEAAKEVTHEPAIGSIQQAMKDFRELSRKEKKSKIKQMKAAIKDYKKQKAAGDADVNMLLLVLLAILIPPLAVYLHEGEINTKFWISLLLTILGFALFGSFGAIFLGSLLGIIYALIVVLS
ncbi:YqaE/Pmp3 family membrane protein [Aridibaculum aurantiacum]|uniref:YqaE/Pmp3 family membrane protein n=1 Tax=Aridibaculum aurantiacum TaxID=2810307 RepID=UPI001A97C2A8|nr:YqaE/Pmp3 family membrane protein [Aridibaculum aurantiacum]